MIGGLETGLERRERNAAALAATIDEHGSYELRKELPGWPEERVREARRQVWQAIEDLADATFGPRRDVEFIDRGDAHVIYWAPPEEPQEE